jgi:hypothetical protein
MPHFTRRLESHLARASRVHAVQREGGECFRAAPQDGAPRAARGGPRAAGGPRRGRCAGVGRGALGALGARGPGRVRAASGGPGRGQCAGPRRGPCAGRAPGPRWGPLGPLPPRWGPLCPRGAQARAQERLAALDVAAQRGDRRAEVHAPELGDQRRVRDRVRVHARALVYTRAAISSS